MMRRATITAVDRQPIGMFDSGFGGLTVARAVIDLLPRAPLVYVGDTGRYPYGPRPLAEVREFALQITGHLIDEHDVGMVIVACNTASAAALVELQATFAVPILGVIGGAAVNAAFVDHFQTLARGHFTVRRLERIYGMGTVRRAYDQLRESLTG